MTKNAYIHIPFCKSKCKYCSFVSYTNSELKSKYLKALVQDIKTNYKNEPLNTLYIGGGTPSLLSYEDVKSVVEKFNLANECEITIELNPDDVSEKYLSELKNIGINRISMGAQTFNDEILAAIGRRHNTQTTINAVKLTQEVGFKNISLDLIYGLPNQTIPNLTKDLDIMTSLNIQHISTYGLKIDEGSYFYTHKPNNLPDDDMQADFYNFIIEYLQEKEYRHYEISNFAKENYEAKHNLNYWNNAEYYGFGVAAHGYQNKIRYSKPDILEKYIKNPLAYKTTHNVTEKEELEEEIFLGFRKAEGIDISNINTKFSIDFERKYQKILEQFCPKYIKKDGNRYFFTTEGFLLSNIILAEFIE